MALFNNSKKRWPISLIDYLYENVQYDSMSDTRKMIVKGKVYVNGLICKNPDEQLGKNDIVEVSSNPSFTETLELTETISKSLPKNKILFENEKIVIVNKGVRDTMNLDQKINLSSSLAIRLKKQGESTSSLTHLYELDDDTKGIVIYSKSNEVFEYLNQLIKSREVQCKYLAVSIPAPFFEDKKVFSLSSPLLRDKYNKYQRAGKPKDENDRLKVRRLGWAKLKEQDFPILEISTKLIRRPNIRFLMSYYGMTIINDKKMGSQRMSFGDLALFCYKIVLPETAQEIIGQTTFHLSKEQVVQDMKKIIEKSFRKGYAS